MVITNKYCWIKILKYDYLISFVFSTPNSLKNNVGCTVRKRTPRFPINHSSRRDNNNIGNYPSPYKRSQRREVDDVAHGAALALTEASQRGGSPHVSQSPYHMKSTPLKGRQKIVCFFNFLFLC